MCSSESDRSLMYNLFLGNVTLAYLGHSDNMSI